MKSFNLQEARDGDGYWYLASPYSNYRDGTRAAFEEACRAAAFLLRQGVRLYCPIAHTHPIATLGDIDPLDHDIWIPFDQPLMAAARGLIVCGMAGWQTSRGVTAERNFFEREGRPVLFLEWPLGE